jgi:hypothetical protein
MESELSEMEDCWIDGIGDYLGHYHGPLNHNFDGPGDDGGGGGGGGGGGEDDCDAECQRWKDLGHSLSDVFDGKVKSSTSRIHHGRNVRVEQHSTHIDHCSPCRTREESRCIMMNINLNPLGGVPIPSPWKGTISLNADGLEKCRKEIDAICEYECATQ